MKTTTRDRLQSIAWPIAVGIALFVMLAVYYNLKTPGSIPWLRIAIVLSAATGLNLTLGKGLRDTERKLRKYNITKYTMTPEEAKAAASEAWNIPVVLRFTAFTLCFSLLFFVVLPGTVGEMGSAELIRHMLFIVAVALMAVAVTVIFSKQIYGVWPSRHSAAKRQ